MSWKSGGSVDISPKAGAGAFYGVPEVAGFAITGGYTAKLSLFDPNNSSFYSVSQSPYVDVHVNVLAFDFSLNVDNSGWKFSVGVGATYGFGKGWHASAAVFAGQSIASVNTSGMTVSVGLSPPQLGVLNNVTALGLDIDLQYSWDPNTYFPGLAFSAAMSQPGNSAFLAGVAGSTFDTAVDAGRPHYPNLGFYYSGITQPMFFDGTLPDWAGWDEPKDPNRPPQNGIGQPPDSNVSPSRPGINPSPGTGVNPDRPGINPAPSAGVNPDSAFNPNNNSLGPFAPVGEQRPGTDSAPSGGIPGYGPGSAGDSRANDRTGDGAFGTSGATQSGNPTGHNVGYNAGYGDDYSGAENNGTGSSYGVAKPTHYSPDAGFLGGVQIQNPSYTPSPVVDLTAPAHIYTPTTPPSAVPAVDPNYGLITVGVSQVYITPEPYYGLVAKPTARPRPRPAPRVRVAPPPAVMVPALVYVPGEGYTNKPSPIDAAGAVAQAALDKGLPPGVARAQAMAVAAQIYHVNPYDPNLQMRIANKTGASTGVGPGKSDHTNNGGGDSGIGGSYHGVATVGDHWGHDSGVAGDKGNGWNGHPVILDLDGNGLSVNTLNTSSQFVDLDGDGYQHRTAWAGDGNGVLVLDADGDGKISRSSEFVFTEWDQTADSDLDALKSVFDTNDNGMLDAGDDRWADFKVMVDGQLVSLASLGISSIGLTATGSGQNFADGSAITGTATFTRTDGSTGAVGDAILASDVNGYIVKTATVTNGDGSKTTTLGGYDKDGTLAFQNRITVSANSLSTATQFDDDGNGTYERSQTDVTTITAGVRQRVVSDFNTDGSLAQRTTTTTSADKTTVTTALDQDGDGVTDQTQVFVRNADGSTVTTVSETSVNGTLLRKVVTTASADGLTKTVQSDSTGTGVYDLTSTETTVVAGGGTRTKTVSDTSSGGTLVDRELTVTSADGRTRTVSHDRDGDGVYETHDVTAITSGAVNSTVTTVSTYNSTNVLIGKTVATTSSDSLSKTVATDSNGDGQADLVSTDVTVVGTGGSLAETQQVKSRDGTLLSSTITNTSGDLKTISISTDANGDGHVDMTKTIVIDGAGVTTSTLSQYNTDGSLVGRTYDQTSADGLSLTSKADIDGDGTYDTVVTDVTTTDASSNRIRTVTTKSANNTLVGSSAVTTSADSLTQSERDDLNGDGTIDRTIVTATVLGGDGSRTVTATTTSASGALLAKTEVKTSADRKTTTTKIDADGDTKSDRTVVDVVNADGSEVTTVSDTDSNGVLHGKTETTVSSDGLTKTVKRDINGDGAYDTIVQAVTAIAASGTRTTTTSTTSSNGTLLARTITAVAANGLSVDIQTDADGDGIAEDRSSDVTVLNADGSKTRTVSETTFSGALIGKTTTVTSATGQTVTTSSDLDGDGLVDTVSSDVKLLGSNGSASETLQTKSRDGSLLSSLTSTTSADGKTTSIATDTDGDGHVDTVKTVVIDAAGVTTSTLNMYNPDSSLAGRRFSQASANGLSLTSKADIDGDGTYDTVVTDVSSIDASANRTRTVTTKSANGALIGSSTVITSANGFTQTEKDDINADGTIDRTIVTATALGGDGSRTVTATTTSTSGAVLATTTMTTSGDGKTTTTTVDANGDGHTDQKQVSVRNADGSTTITAIDVAAIGDYEGKSTTTVSADGLTKTTVLETNSFDYVNQGAIYRIYRGILGRDPDQAGFQGQLSSLESGTPETTVISAVLGSAEFQQRYGSLDNTQFVTLLYQNALGRVPDSASLNSWVSALNGGQSRASVAQGIIESSEAHSHNANAELDWAAANTSVTGTASETTKDTTVLNADGSRTETLQDLAGDGTLLSKRTVTTSGNGLSVSTQVDADGDGTVENKSTDVTVLNADGSTARTVSALAGTGALIGKTITTTSANGLTSTVQADLDGNGTIDRTTTATTVLGADGSKTDTITAFNGTGVRISRRITATSGDGHNVVTTTETDGTGITGEMLTTTLNANGSTTQINRAYVAGSMTSSATKTVSANGLSSTLAADLDGNGAIDQSTTDVIVLNADGSKTETITDLDAAGAVKDKTTVVTSANGLVQTMTWAAVGATTSRSKVDTTVLNAGGSTTETIDYKKADGSLESRTITTVSANKLTTTVTKDYNGDGAVDLTTTTVTAADGSVTTTTTGPDTTANALGTGAYTTAPSTTSKTTTISADGLSSTTLYGATSVDYLPDLPTKRTTETTIGADGSTVQTIKGYESTTLIEQTRTTTAGDGLAVTKEWDLNGDGTYDRKETDVTVLNADGSNVQTVNKFEGATQTSSFVTTTSANGLSVTTSLDLFGANPFSQDSTDVTAVNTDGSTTRTVTNYKADGSQLSKFITTTPSDGRVVTTQEDTDGVVGVDRVTVDDTRVLADGSVLETVKRSTPAGGLLDSSVTTTSSDGRLISISRDADGDGTVDQTEVTTKAVDGSVTTLITDFSGANHKLSTTKISTSADGLLTTTQWDFDANGTIDQTRRINVANLGDGITDTKTLDTTGPSNTFYNKTTTYSSDDGRSSWTGIDYDASGGGFDNMDSIITMADGSTVEGIHNRNQDASHLIPGTIYWQAAIPANVVIKTSADGLTTNYWYDYDGTAASPVSVENPDVTFYEVTAVGQVQIDGSVVTQITGRQKWNGPIISKGTLTVSADGMTTTLLKDADNNGTYEHKEVAITRIDGSIHEVVTDYNSSGLVTQTVTTDVSADGQSTSVITANATTGTGTTTSVGVEFVSPGTTNDTITGSAGDDQINGGAGNDTINGGAGDDYIDGGIGADTMNGGAGNDTFVVDNASDQVVEAASQGTDTVLSSVTYTISDADVENLTLTGSAPINGNGNNSANVLTGNSGDNTLDAGSGNDTIYGGAGNDFLLGSAGDDTIYGGVGADYMNGGNGSDTLVYQRGDGADRIEDFVVATTTATADINAASALNVKAGGIVDTWVGGFNWQTSTNSLQKAGATSGSDTLKLTGGISADNLSFAWGGPGQDNLLLTIAGGPAGDSINLSQYGIAVGKIEKLQLDELGTLNLYVAPTIGGTVSGSTSADILFGLGGNEWLDGGNGDDILFGGAGSDILAGDDGNDRLIGGNGDDNLQGDDGSNEYIFRPGDGSDYLTDFAWPVTTAAADITAANALNVKAGGIVNTWIGGYYYQTATSSLLKASGSGTSTLTLQGGITLDNLSFAWTRNGEDLTIYTGGVGDAVTISEYNTAPGRIDKMTFDGIGSRSFFIASNVGSTVNGGADGDLMFGLSGNDSLWGFAGNDYIRGGAGNDFLAGGDGDDTLIGGTGSDYQNGENGGDTYVFKRGDGNDAIQDFLLTATTAAADISAAQALGISATGTVNTWIGGYYWQTSSNSLLKLIAGTGSDTLVLQGGVTPGDMTFTWTGAGADDLQLSIAGGDSITLYQQKTAAAKIEKLALDGIGTLNLAVAGGVGGTANGTAEADIVFGLNGDETLYGNAGNDVFYGRLGNDTLVGGLGNDIYNLGRGGGADTIIESGSYNDNDELDFASGIGSNELWFAQQGNDLVISLLGTTDKMTVTGWFAGPGNVVETIKSGDGKVLRSSDVATLVAAMAGFDPATSPTGSGIQPNDPRLGDPNQIGTIASAMQHSWMAA